MYGDFSAFVGAWALLLSCVALVIEPIAHGSRWFSRALRLATGIAGLITFFAARHIWQLIRVASREDGPPAGWDPFRSLAAAFIIFWVMSAVGDHRGDGTGCVLPADHALGGQNSSSRPLPYRRRVFLGLSERQRLPHPRPRRLRPRSPYAGRAGLLGALLGSAQS